MAFDENEKKFICQNEEETFCPTVADWKSFGLPAKKALMVAPLAGLASSYTTFPYKLKGVGVPALAEEISRIRLKMDKKKTFFPVIMGCPMPRL